MSQNGQDSYDLDDHTWSLLEPHLPGRKGSWGGTARDNRQFVNGVFWILRTGSPWRDLPPEYGDWKNTHRRFCRWRDKGTWELLLDQLLDEPGFEWLIVDASHDQVPPHGAGVRGRSRSIGRTQGDSTARYIWPWMRLICRSESLLQKLPVRIGRQLSG